MKKLYSLGLILLFVVNLNSLRSQTIMGGSLQTTPARSCSTTVFDVTVQLPCANMVHLGNSLTIIGTNITINLNYTMGIICLPAIVTTTQNINLGSLPAGTYTVTMNGQLNATTVSTGVTTFMVQGCCPHEPNFNLSADSICPGDSVFATNTTSGPYSNLSWKKNGVGIGSPQNFADIFTTLGPNYITLITSDGTCTDSITKEVFVNPFPQLDLGNDTIICEGKRLTLNGGTNRDSVFWWDNSTSSTKVIDTLGTYWVDVYEKGCGTRDTIVVGLNPSPNVDIGGDTNICKGSTFVLDATTSGVTYKWHDNSTNPTFTVTGFGQYSVTVTNSVGCTDQDAVLVGEFPLPVVDLGEDSILCQGDTLYLDAGIPSGVAYQWQDGASGSIYPATSTNIFWVIVSDSNGCAGIDSVSLGFINCFPGFDENELSGVNVYPVPAKDELTIDLGSSGGIFSEYSLVDISGRLILSEKISGNKGVIKIDVSELPQGLYFMQIRSGNKFHNKPVIIE